MKIDSVSEVHIREFVAYLKYEKRYSVHTSRSYEDDLVQFVGFIHIQFGTISLINITSAFVRSWLASLKENGLTSKSINRKISSLKSFFKYHMRMGNISKTPMSTIVSPKVSKRLPSYVEQKDIHILTNFMEFPDTWKGRTERLLLFLLYNTGMRLSELVQLKESQVNFSNKSLKILGKGNKERIIPLSKELAADIKEYLKEKKQLPPEYDLVYLLVDSKGKKLYNKYVYLVVKRYLSLVTTIDKKSPHILRHTFATHLTNNGADLNAIKELLGHSSLAATQVYTHNSIEKLKEAHNNAHPKA